MAGEALSRIRSRRRTSYVNAFEAKVEKSYRYEKGIVQTNAIKYTTKFVGHTRYP